MYVGVPTDPTLGAPAADWPTHLPPRLRPGMATKEGGGWENGLGCHPPPAKQCSSRLDKLLCVALSLLHLVYTAKKVQVKKQMIGTWGLHHCIDEEQRSEPRSSPSLRLKGCSVQNTFVSSKASIPVYTSNGIGTSTTTMEMLENQLIELIGGRPQGPASPVGV